MADSESRTTTQAWRTMAAFSGTQEDRTCEVEGHGLYRSMVFPGGSWSECPKCEDVRIKAQREQERLERERENEEYYRREAFRKSEIPPRFAEKFLDNFVAHTDGAKKALAIATAYAGEFEERSKDGTSLILCGGVGTGKTHLAIGIGRRVLDLKKSVLFVSVMNAVRSVKETYNRDSEESERDVLLSFIRPSLLILDEVGAQFGSDTEKLILFEIINGRYEKMRPTIVVSNLAKDALGDFLGERAVDRLRENGGRLVAFDWASYRKQVA
jgi:DNA replication protein DnaC